ncbi:ABC transporter permease [Actinopolymorpha pittospori]|uniref:Transport permease protein n=1 Tax=Actinopolymorpha pittospori TaxID=648752 RepID=A0A927MWA6_9ACTN|nr:teichoic acid transport system permease protein [Actinopolymorpha pittospori]
MSTTTTSATPAELATRYGLVPSAARPKLFTYVGQVWQRRHFITSFATSRTATMYSSARLGQLWQVLTPLMNAAVYYFIFGVLFATRHTIDNFIAFLVTGVFVMSFTTRSVTTGARAISGNLGIIRALHFPRAALPLSSTIVEFQQMLVSMFVLCLIVLATGEPITLTWLLAIPALALQTLFNTGLALILARIGSTVPDISQLLPFMLRTWLYLSGVFFVIPERVHDRLLQHIMLANPTTVYIELVRDALIEQHGAPHYAWPLAVGWAVVAFVVGFWYFWGAEEKYGRG